MLIQKMFQLLTNSLIGAHKNVIQWVWTESYFIEEVLCFNHFRFYEDNLTLHAVLIALNWTQCLWIVKWLHGIISSKLLEGVFKNFQSLNHSASSIFPSLLLSSPLSSSSSIFKKVTKWLCQTAKTTGFLLPFKLSLSKLQQTKWR